MLKIIKAHYRKQWLSFLTVALFVFIASLMMSVGITIATESKTYYSEKAAEQNLADYQVALFDLINHENAEFYNNLAKQIVISDELVEDYEIVKKISLLSKDNDSFQVNPYIKDSKISKLNAGVNRLGESEIILNQFAKLRLGFNIGDKIELYSPNIKKEFVVVGFYEELMEMYDIQIYMNEKIFNAFSDDIYQYKKELEEGADTAYWIDTIIKIKASNPNYLNKLVAKVTEDYAPIFAMGNVELGYSIYTQTSVQENIMSFATILSVVLIVFACIILIVCLIIIRFSLVSFIEDDIKNTGILKGLGYSNKDIRLILLSEYLIVALGAAILGAIVSIFVAPAFSTIISKTVDLLWRAVPSSWVIIASIILPIMFIALFVWILSRKINRITPLNALRRGIETHSFKHNYFPLEKFDKCTNLVLSAKGILNQALRYVSVGLVVLVISFVSVFAVILHYNLNVSNVAFAALTGAETADALVRGKAISDEELLAMPEIDRISYSGYGDSVKVKSSDQSMYCRVGIVKDFGISTVSVLYKGRNPDKANEIMIPIKIADYFSVGIGDTLFCGNGKDLKEFLITGLCQNMSAPEQIYICGVATENMYGIPPENFNYYNAYIYLKNGVDYDAFIAKLREMNTQGALGVADRDESANVYITPSLKDGAMLLTIAMDVITAVCVAMVLLFILRLKIIREQKTIAINKALGATTKDIVIQMTFGIVCVIGLFALIGGLLGALLTGVMLKLALSSFAIMSIKLAIPWGIVIAMIVAITAFSFAVAALIALRTRRVTPRSLISNQ